MSERKLSENCISAFHEYLVMEEKSGANWSWDNFFFSTIWLVFAPECTRTRVFA